MKMSHRRQALYRRTRQIFLMEFVEAILAAVVVAMLLRIFVVSVYRVPTESMMPTLIPGDFIVAWKSSYGVRVPFVEDRVGARDPSRGDVVIFQSPDEESKTETIFVKRVVGVPGDRIEIRNGVLSVNDVSTAIPKDPIGDWDFAEETTGTSTHRVMRRHATGQAEFMAPMIVPPGHVFLMGDLRSESFDSRHWGPIPVDAILARAAFIGVSLAISGAISERRDESGAMESLSSKADFVPAGRIRWNRLLKTIE